MPVPVSGENFWLSFSKANPVGVRLKLAGL